MGVFFSNLILQLRQKANLKRNQVIRNICSLMVDVQVKNDFLNSQYKILHLIW